MAGPLGQAHQLIEGANHRSAGRAFPQQATNLLTLAGSVSPYASKYQKHIKSYNLM
jgi:hypothetical protein